MDNNLVKITLVKSFYGRISSHIACVKGLGLKKIHHTVTVENTPCNRGMIDKVAYLLKIEDA